MSKEVDYLEEDTNLPLEQNYVCMSFLRPSVKETTLSGIKIRGVFDTYDEACKHAAELQHLDPYFNVFVGAMGKWLAYDPDPDSKYVKDSEYANKKLNNIMKGYLDNQKRAKKYYNERVQQGKESNLQHNLDVKKENKLENDSKKELDEKNVKKQLSELDEQIKQMEADKEKVVDKQSAMKKKIQV